MLEAECDALKHDIEGHLIITTSILAERDELKATLKATLEARGEELDQLRRDLERERQDCAAKSKTHQGELSELRLAFEREREELQAQLKVRGDELAALHVVSHRERGDRDLIAGETNAIVPKATLRQARAQFEYLAKECIPHGDIASQVMCELGAHTMDLALTAGGEGETDNLPAGEVALSIFAPPGSTSPAIADTM